MKNKYAFGLAFLTLLAISTNANAWFSRNKCCDPCANKVEKKETVKETKPVRPVVEEVVEAPIVKEEIKEVIIPQEQGIAQEEKEIIVETKTIEKKTNYYPGLW